VAERGPLVISEPGSITPAEKDIKDLRLSLVIGADAAGIKARGAARKLMYAADAVTDAGERYAAYAAVKDLLDEMYRWKDAWASEHVDKDRQVRRAMADSASCEHHGQEIRDMQAQLTGVRDGSDRHDKARSVLLGWYQTCVDFERGYRELVDAGKPTPDATKIVAWMGKQLPRVSAAYHRAWNPRPAKPKGK
jgi:hypothetical protein